MKITIGVQVDVMTSKAGKEYKKFNVRKEDGTIVNGVVAFPFYSLYASIVSGAVLEGIIKEEEYNGGKSYKLADGNLGPKPASFGGGAKNMELKAKNIEKAQDRKEDGIMISSTARMATEMVLALKGTVDGPENVAEFKEAWLEWRKWFVQNWENTNGVPKVAGTDITYPTSPAPEDIPF